MTSSVVQYHSTSIVDPDAGPDEATEGAMERKGHPSPPKLVRSDFINRNLYQMKSYRYLPFDVLL